jgi:aryl-alcohol dehydrogenase-like predicted oxidoreductase
MVGFNMINQSARERVLKRAMEKDIGILVMFAVRRALSIPEKLKEIVQGLINEGQLDANEIDLEDPLGFLIHQDGATSLPDAAYRFCRDELSTHVILSGTGNEAHLRENIQSFSRPPLPEQDMEKVKHIFQRVDSVTGE